MRLVRGWGLWSLPPAARRYVIIFELVTLIAVTFAFVTSPAATAADWRAGGVLVGAGMVHLWLTRRTEETRRDRGPGPHMDTSVVWFLPAMVLLPAWMAVLALMLLRVQLYPVARRPLFRYTFGTAGILVAALGSYAVVRVAGVTVDTAIGPRDVLVLTLAGLAYFVLNALSIAGVIALSAPQPTWTTVIGSRRDNALAALTVCLGVLAALAIANAWLAPLFLVPLLCAMDWGALQIENLRGDARTDHKTQLLNSRGWHEQAGRELARAKRQRGTTLAVAVLDLDYFKQVNDTWGHPAGDAVLRAVGAVLRESVRQGDVVGRFGGEEFVLLFPDTDLDAAAMVAERIRLGVAAMSVAATDKRGQPVVIANRTTSIGVAAATGDDADLETLLQRADAAVYEAKNGGRDQVRKAEPPTAEVVA
ncbi:GGDEF domain-containing protein [Actinokineospora auranticolor]|uniref:Diguanylate cyclase (GGDEF)-like protein n=1 Tax=Actinokineospora auranticolor TaxID=155976 RepID=A0A2S6GUQ0_9PSEU|nr:GGDEF domain-containing protein [Actinokineospora auranticolor]PPK68968.1 diguanylate cyclase (GGDEF)-like protein [Actinokineospora auranticolor]